MLSNFGVYSLPPEAYSNIRQGKGVLAPARGVDANSAAGVELSREGGRDSADRLHESQGRSVGSSGQPASLHHLELIYADGGGQLVDHICGVYRGMEGAVLLRKRGNKGPEMRVRQMSKTSSNGP